MAQRFSPSDDHDAYECLDFFFFMFLLSKQKNETSALINDLKKGKKLKKHLQRY